MNVRLIDPLGWSEDADARRERRRQVLNPTVSDAITYIEGVTGPTSSILLRIAGHLLPSSSPMVVKKYPLAKGAKSARSMPVRAAMAGREKKLLEHGSK